MSQYPDKNNKAALLQVANHELKSGNPIQALELLRSIASPSDNASTQAAYARLATKISAQLNGFPVLRIAFLANATLDHWVDYLRFWLLLQGFRLEENLIPFGTWRQQVLDKHSDLYQFCPDVIWFFLQLDDLNFHPGIVFGAEATSNIVDSAISDIAHQVSIVADNHPALSIVNNIVPPASRVLGNYEGSTTSSLSTAIQRFNLEIVTALPKDSCIFDIAHIAAKFGLVRWEDARLWHYSKHPFSLEAQGEVAFAASCLLGAAKGGAKKCVILDLDNTLWGGEIGDDGVGGILIGSDGGAVGEAYASFQAWLKALAHRGIALAVCSKNTEALAKEPFFRKPGMPLKLDDFVSFKANWNNKADNIRNIAEELNLGLDSLVFLDDNPAERALVRSELPQVVVPELPPDPADYIQALASGCWFETLAISNEDRLRVISYQQNTARQQAQHSATDLDSYLKSLDMHATWGKVDSLTLQRATQLINKTNQFHLTTTRYTESQISAMILASDKWVGHFSLGDRFGEYGVIAVVILCFEAQTAIIDTWSMSCRVFSRTMEDFIFSVLWSIAKEQNCKELIGKYIPTAKNQIVAKLYKQLGGLKLSTQDNSSEQCWRFDLSGLKPTGSLYIKDLTNLS